MGLKQDFAAGQNEPQRIIRHVLAALIYCQSTSVMRLSNAEDEETLAKAAYAKADSFLKVADGA